MVQSFADRMAAYLFSLSAGIQLHDDISWIETYQSVDAVTATSQFLKQYYSDTAKRYFMFGINPGRFGAGITGVSFTDPIRLKNDCGIDHPFDMKPELSSDFVYRVIHQYGSVDSFYKRFFITSICPLGFVKQGKNYNYYDDKELYKRVKPLIVEHLQAQLTLGAESSIAYCIGTGKNADYFHRLNDELQLFDNIIIVPHPRWVMQYRRKRMDEFIDVYLKALRQE